MRCDHKPQWSIEDTQLKWAQCQGKLAGELGLGPRRTVKTSQAKEKGGFPKQRGSEWVDFVGVESME